MFLPSWWHRPHCPLDWGLEAGRGPVSPGEDHKLCLEKAEDTTNLSLGHHSTAWALGKLISLLQSFSDSQLCPTAPLWRPHRPRPVQWRWRSGLPGGSRQEEDADSNLKTKGQPVLKASDQGLMVFLSDPKCEVLKYQDTRALPGRSRASAILEGGPWLPWTRVTQPGCLLITKIHGLHP